MDFRPRIKEILKEQGLLQKNLAKRLGITEIGLSQTLGQPYPQLQTLERIAAALGVEVIDLFKKPAPDKGVVACPNCGATLKIHVEAQ
jgi:transcriptional regulator with XRE-family HTH domain